MSRRTLAAVGFLLGVVLAAPNGFLVGWLSAPTATVKLPPISRDSSFEEIKLHLSASAQDRGPAEIILPRHIQPGSGCVVWRSFELPWRLAYCEVPQGGGPAFQPQQAG